MDESVSGYSRSPSIFSLDSYPSSLTSEPPSPRMTFDEKDATQQKPAISRPLVLQWRPQFFSSAFNHHTSTHIRFTAFPPSDYRTRLQELDSLSLRTALSILHNTQNATALSVFATPNSTVSPVCAIPIPSNIPMELVNLLHNDTEWQLYSISELAPVPVSINAITLSSKHYVAFRKLHDGVERYIFGPASLSVHSISTIVYTGRPHDDAVPPEPFYLEEHTEVICNKATKWLYKNSIIKKIKEAHEEFRIQWNGNVMREWATSSSRIKSETDCLINI